jgi:hypothetical protein
MYHKGRYPIYNTTHMTYVKLKDLTFEIDMKVQLLNRMTRLIGDDYDEPIGELVVPLKSLA